MKIKCNFQPRPVLWWHELTAIERAEFDYIDTLPAQDCATFFRYKGQVYDLGEFARISPAIAPHPQRPQWERFDGYAGDSYFSGTLVKYVDSHDSVIVATYFC